MIKTIFLISALCFFLISCGDSEEGTDHNPTPYDLTLPPFFGDNYTFPDDNPLTNEGVELGRMLFYEKKLSRDNSISCSSCHQQDKAFTDGRAFSKGIEDQTVPFSAMSLANLPWSSHFFWNGRSDNLEELSFEPIENPLEMDQSLTETIEKLQNTENYPPAFFEAFGSDQITAENLGKSLAQFQRTLISSNSKYDKYLAGELELSAQEKLGEQLFFTHPEPLQLPALRGGNCGDCHVNILTAGVNDNFEGFKNNGLEDDGGLENGLFDVTGSSSDLGKFKVPTLRNIALTAPYMHDGRFETLEEVLDHYNDHIQRSATLDPLIIEASNEEIIPGNDIKLHLTQDEKEAIIAFLHTLTDNEFINDEKFSSPF